MSTVIFYCVTCGKEASHELVSSVDSKGQTYQAYRCTCGELHDKGLVDVYDCPKEYGEMVKYTSHLAQHWTNKVASSYNVIKILRCLRCNHEWPSKLQRPRVCPKCHSPYWDRERSR